jgi:hypothetical protein
MIVLNRNIMGGGEEGKVWTGLNCLKIEPSGELL